MTDTERYTAACWFVLGAYAATRKPSKELTQLATWAKQGVTGGFFNPFHGWAVRDWAEKRAAARRLAETEDDHA